jgi:hypothetical protein
MGWVYAFETPSMPGIVKIGATDRDPVERLHEANDPDTWRPPEAYRIAWAIEADSPFAVERRVHTELAELRINPRREFFRIPADEAQSLAMALALIARRSPPLGVQSGPADVPTRLQRETEDENARDSYEALKARFETCRFKTVTLGKAPFHSVDLQTGEIVSGSMNSFKVAYMDWIPVGGKQFVERWLNDGLKRSYNRIEYGCVKKENQESTVYYAFPELRHERLVSSSTEDEKRANIDYFRDYVRLLVEDKDEYVEWLVMWLADILVNPDDKGQTPIAVVLWGEHGAGKTFLRELMASLLGERLVHHTDDPLKNGDILHDLNSTLKYKLFLEFEEINFKTHNQVARNIKELMTRRTHTITHKEEGSVDVKATERILFTTNAAGSVVIERRDSRYAAFAVSPRRVGDVHYWNEHHRKLQDASYIKDVAEYLISYEAALAHYVLRDRRPMTEYYKSLREPSPSPELDFLRDTFMSRSFGQEFIAQFASGAGLYAIPSSMMCGEYNRWRAESALKDHVSSKSFTMKMVSHGSTYGIRRDTTGKQHNSFVIDAAKMCAALARDVSG